MSDIIRLVDGLAAGDPTAQGVLVFAAVGTAVILGAVALIRRGRR